MHRFPPFPSSSGRVRRLRPVLGLLFLGAFGATPAWSQEPPAQEPPAGQEQDQDESDKGPGRLVRNPLEVLRETDPADVAFWVHLDGMGVEPVPVTQQEWDEYMEMMHRIYLPVLPMEPLLITNAVRLFLEQRVSLMSHEAEMTAMVKKANEVARKLRRDVDFVRLVHQYTDDKTLKQVDGRAGIQSHSMLRYPLDLELFRIPVGETAGPFWTLYGAEFFRAEETVGEAGTLGEGVSVRQISLYFNTQDETQRRHASKVRQHLRLRTDKEYFRQVLPPALQTDPPEHFGPTDVAPLGDPDRILGVGDGHQGQDAKQDAKQDKAPDKKDGAADQDG